MEILAHRENMTNRKQSKRKLAATLSMALFFSSFSVPARAAGLPTADRVLVIYNANWTEDLDGDGVQDSLEVASYYALKRGVAADHVLGLPVTAGAEYVDFDKFKSEVITPIQTKLNQLGPENIDILLLCYGMPLDLPGQAGSVGLDNTLMNLNYWTSPPPTYPPTFWIDNPPYHDFAPGFDAQAPHFDHSFKFAGLDTYLVTRLDGPRGPTGAMELVDQALYSDRFLAGAPGYFSGNIYVDSRNLADTPPYDDAFLSGSLSVRAGDYSSLESTDENLAYTEHYALNSPFPLKWEKTYASIGSDPGLTFQDGSSAATAPRALFYAGWYNLDNYLDVWDWLPGSVASDLDSSSLATARLRSPNPSAWGAAALWNGATCVSGALGEPYSIGHPRGNILIYYLLNGYSFAEAAALATPSFGWQGINIGDPLYAPLRTGKPLVKDTRAPALLAGYPQVAPDATGSLVVRVVLDDSVEPEVGKATVDFGLDSTYGQSANSGNGYWRRLNVTLPNLPPNTIYHYRIRIVDPVGNLTTTPDITFTTPDQRPYLGAPSAIPGTIEAENFDTGGEGVAYHDSEPANLGGAYRLAEGVDIYNTGTGGYYVGHMVTGEWMEYTVNIAASGIYQLQVRLGGFSENAISFQLDGHDISGFIMVPQTGSFSVFQTVTLNTTTSLPAGLHVLRLTTNNYGFSSVDSFTFLPTGSTNPGTNLAQGKLAAQSSTLPGYSTAGAGSAVDGNTDGAFFDGSVTATNLDSNAWWQVDLGASGVISSIVVWNRTDCCGPRLTDFWVFVSDTPFLPTDTPATLQNRAGTFSSHQTVAPNPSVTIAANGAAGRYVRVQLTGGNYLSLAEVQVIGTGGAPPPTNLALGRSASQSSTFPGYPSAGAAAAVDGNPDGNFFDGSVTATNLDPNPWWQVDLGASAAIGSIVIWNRTDCCATRLSDYWVFVSDTPFLPTDTPATLQSRTGTFSSHQATAPGPSTSIAAGAQGRYVRVQLTSANYLSLAEVQVFASGSASGSQNIAIASQSK
jgi:hypothetical protein